jgi:hypothetical protein
VVSKTTSEGSTPSGRALKYRIAPALIPGGKMGYYCDWTVDVKGSGPIYNKLMAEQDEYEGN